MTLREELEDLEVAATHARAQDFPGLADAFERVADTLRAEISQAESPTVPDPDVVVVSTSRNSQRAARSSVAA